MIVDLPNTTTNDINKRITSLREGWCDHLGRVLSLVVVPDAEEILEDAIEAAVASSREHPAASSWWCRPTSWQTNRGWTASFG